MSARPLIERLAGLGKLNLPTCSEAAARISELEAERDRLREALERAAEFLKKWDSGHPGTPHGWFYDEFFAEHNAIRAALKDAET